MTQHKATLAGGCFWGMEELMRQWPGVISTRVGYTGGSGDLARYEFVKTGRTGHAEAIEVTFDDTLTSYQAIVERFFKIHDPTTINRQGNDIGSQYRSAIFYHDDIQKKVAEEVIKNMDQSGFWSKPIVTQLVAAQTFYPAEEFHQKYLVKNPGGYTCHFERT